MANFPSMEEVEAVAREYGIALNRFYSTGEVAVIVKLSKHRLKIIRKEVLVGKRKTLLVWSLNDRNRPQYKGWDIVYAIIGQPDARRFSEAAE